MSCHSIGKGINAIVRRTITLYDRGEIAFEPTKKIIATCANAVNWCDGNEYEALDYILKCRCGKCLKLIPCGEKLYSLYDLPKPYKKEPYIICDELEMASDVMCENCFDQYMQRYSDEIGAVEEMKKYIENTSDEYLSEGAHPACNNRFYPWGEPECWYEY